MRPRRLLRRLLDGSYTNVKFNDFQRLAEACGFELDRVAGSPITSMRIQTSR
jgi:hypothetical protein